MENTMADTCTLTYQYALSNATPTVELQEILKKIDWEGKKQQINFSIEVKQLTKKKKII